MRADRLLRLLMLLQRHRRVTAAWLADELEVSERTVLRDMEALSAAGVPVYTERGRHGGCVLLDDFTTEATGITPAEAQALFAWSSRDTVADLGLGPALTSALTKIAATAPSGALADAEALGTIVHSDRRRWYAATENVPWLPTLREATSATAPSDTRPLADIWAGLRSGLEQRVLWHLAVRLPQVVAALAVHQAPDLLVVEPVWLRDEVRAAALRALEHYPARDETGI
jgi:predicted DNA-binding transcriptional regulator YafY